MTNAKLVCDSGDGVTVGIDMACDGGYVNSVCDRDVHVHSTSVHCNLDANSVCDSGDVDGTCTCM